jgi:hypothetical protein
MKAFEELRLAALHRVQDFNVKHAVELAAINEFPVEKTDLDTSVTKIEKARAINAANIKTIAVEKTALQNAMAEIIYKYQLRAAVKAHQLGDMELELALDLSKDYMLKNNDDTVAVKAEEIKNVIKNNLAQLTNINPADITVMEDAITAYVNKKDETKEAIDDRKSLGTDPMPDLLNEADVPKNNIGKLVLSYLPDLAHEWDVAARVGRPTGVRHTSIAILITDALSGIRLKDVRCTITNGIETIAKLSSVRGWVKFFSLDNALWNIITEYPNYDTVTHENISTEESKITRLEIKLDKKPLSGQGQTQPDPETTTGSFSVKCIDKNTGQPKGNLLLTIPVLNLTFDSDEDGEFFGDSVPPGTYIADISGIDIVTLEVTISITAGQHTETTVLVEPST